MRVSGILFAAVLTSMSAAKLGAQGGNAGRATAPSSDASARSTTLKDFTGYWVSVVTEDWRWRMVVPDKGDYVTIPLNADGRKVADAWDPARDQATGNPLQCRREARRILQQLFLWRHHLVVCDQRGHGSSIPHGAVHYSFAFQEAC